jgi:autotransporter-associated beta strand protein
MAKPSRKSRLILGALVGCSLFDGVRAFADFSGTPIVFNTDGGWSWFSDPRVIIDNNQLIIGSVAGANGTISNGNGGTSTAGDLDVTDFNFNTSSISETLLASKFDQDDHADPSFTVLPDGKIMVVYQTHGANNDVEWRLSTISGEGTSWSAQNTSDVNVANDGNGNTYGNPFYLAVPNEVVSFSRAIGYDPNYSVFTNLSAATPTFSYGGHWMYWQNPNNESLTGGNGRPYVKYASNGTNTVWFATTEDSPQNYLNSLYAGYMQFNSGGVGTVYTSTGTALGGLSTGTAPTGNGGNPPVGGNQGPISSGTGDSYLPTEFTPIVKADQNLNGLDLSSSSPYGAGYVGWATSMQLDGSGDPYLGFVVVRNLNGDYGNDLEYDYAHFVGGSWQVDRVGYAGLPLYNGQNQYAGLMAVDPQNPNKIYISDDVNPTTDTSILGPDDKQHWEIFEGVTSNNGSSWSWTQLTDTASDNIRPIVTAGDGEEALTWMQGTYTSYTDFNTSVVGLIQSAPTNISWDNLSANNLWDTASSNWINGSLVTTYTNGSNVTLNDNNPGPSGTPADYSITLNTTVSPASLTVNNSAGNYIISGTGSIAGSGSLTKTGSSSLTLNTVNTYTGGTNVSGGMLTVGVTGALPVGAVSITGGTLNLAANTGLATLTSLLISGAGTFDITNNHVIVTYGASDPMSVIEGYLASGYNNGEWNGTGIISSAAATQDASGGFKYGVGWADGGDGTHTVAGLSSGQIELKYTLLGDANLDGFVNGSDFSILAANFGQGFTNWDQGNFLFTPLINGADFSALAANFGQGDSGATVAITQADVAALDAFAAANGLPLPTIDAIPEPACMGLITMAALGVLARRRRGGTRSDTVSVI